MEGDSGMYAAGMAGGTAAAGGGAVVVEGEIAAISSKLATMLPHKASGVSMGLVVRARVFCSERTVVISSPPWISSMGLPWAKQRASGV